MELSRYAAFISYSSKDAAFARRLHRALETYRIPASLGTFDLIGGGKQNRVYPVFRDREELSAGRLGDLIEANLKASAALIVVCSPNGAVSPWVQKEIELFVSLGRREKIYAIIADSAPLLDASGADCTRACFPPAFQGEALAGDALEPLAADARKGKDGFRSAWLKVVAGMIGVSPGQLVDRDKKRRRQQRRAVAASAAALAAALAVAGAWLDASAWRTALTGSARDMIGEGASIEATPFALAGLPPRGALLSAAGQGASDAALGSGALGIVVDLSPQYSSAIAVSDDGRFILAQNPDEETEGLLYDLRNPDLEPINLGGEGRRFICDESECSFSPNGRYLVLRDSLIDISAPNDRVDLGEIFAHEFTSDSRFVITRDSEHAYLRDLSAPVQPRSLGSVLNIVYGDGLYLSHDGQSLVVMNAVGDATLFDLRAPDPSRAARPLGPTFLVAFSADSRFLLVQQPIAESDASSEAFLYDLEHNSDPLPMGAINRFSFSPHSSHLLTSEADGDLFLRILSRPTESFRLGPRTAGIAFSRDGRFLATRDYYYGYLHDLSAPAAAPTDLGSLQQAVEIDSFAFSNDSRYLLTINWTSISRNDRAQLRDLQNSSDPVDLGEVSFDGFAFSNNGQFLMIRDIRGAPTLRRLSAVNVPIQLERPSVSHSHAVRFSDDSRFLLAGDSSGLYLLDLDHPEGALLPLGSAEGRFFAEGRILITFEESGNSVVRELDKIKAPFPRGARLRADICAGDGQALRPFPRDVRAGQQAAPRIRNALEGRPWNPCDWRGLLAVFPDVERGDGWFEGPRQWLRLMHIRHFGGADWRCEETTSLASEATRAARARMCARFAPEAEPA
jgi:WD40 repeat protein